MLIWSRILTILSLLLSGAGLATGLRSSSAVAQTPNETDSSPSQEIYVAPLQPLNESMTEQGPIGLATFIIQGDEMEVYVMAEGLPPGMPHLQHYHGFTDGTAAECPTAQADANNDGVIDLTETQATSGQTLVPLHDAPASLEGLLTLDRFPVATSPEGMIDYRQTVSVQELESGLQSQHDIEDLSLDRRVVFLHGVGESANVPNSAQSIADVPASTTLPIACGEITRVD